MKRVTLRVFTSASQAANVIHRAMIIEARSVLQVPSSKILAHLKDHPDAVRRLTRYRQVPGEFSRARVRILDVTYREIHGSKQYRDDYGLLTDTWLQNPNRARALANTLVAIRHSEEAGQLIDDHLCIRNDEDCGKYEAGPVTRCQGSETPFRSQASHCGRQQEDDKQRM